MFDLSLRYQSYKRTVKDDCLYSTCLKENKISNNSFAQLSNHRYVKIREFLIDENTENKFTVINYLRTQNMLNNASPTIQTVLEIEQNLNIVSINDIVKPCVMFKFSENMFLCALPNTLHY